MFNKQEMKLISYEQAKKKLMKKVPVFMVKRDGTLEELTESTDWQYVLIHNLTGGTYAVYRKRFNGIGSFHKSIHIGKRNYTVEHIKKGGGTSWMFASYRDSQ